MMARKPARYRGHGPNSVGGGWQQYTRVFPGGGNIIYGILPDGTLTWSLHQGFRAGIGPQSGPESVRAWSDTRIVGRGWGNYTNVFSGGGGIIYAITQAGKLLWFRHIDYTNGVKAFEGPREVGSDWNTYRHVFSGGNGILYAITQDGSLLWFRHIDYANGVKAFEGPKVVGRGWGNFKNVFSTGDGIIYAITEDGKLQWRKYNGYLTGGGYDTWQGPTEIATGWGGFRSVFALLPGSSGVPNPTSHAGTATQVYQSDTIAARDRASAEALKSAAPPQYQELRCRGGGLRFRVVNGRTNSSGEPTMYMTVYFKPAAQPAGASGHNLQPGSCAFTERGVRADEPNEIILEIVSFAQTRQQLHGTPVDTSPTAAERYPDAQNLPQYLDVANHYWSFFVHQNAPLPSGRFEGSSGGRYWKPALSSEDVIRSGDSTVPNKQRRP